LGCYAEERDSDIRFARFNTETSHTYLLDRQKNGVKEVFKYSCEEETTSYFSCEAGPFTLQPVAINYSAMKEIFELHKQVKFYLSTILIEAPNS
jgi:hypothetical protein